MRIIKYTHACVRLESGDRALVIDPGIWSEPEALDGADAVLLTHEHSDHVDAARLAGSGLAVYAPADFDLGDLDVPVTLVRSGEDFVAAGFAVRAVGRRHAFAFDGQPDCANLGYVVDGLVYHPGDALHVPEQQVQTLLVPLHGSWLKTDEAIRFVRTIGPTRRSASTRRS